MRQKHVTIFYAIQMFTKLYIFEKIHSQVILRRFWKKTGVSHITDARAKKGAGKHERPKIKFDKDQFLNTYARRERDVWRVLKLAKGPVLRTTSEGPAEIYDFLGIESF